jgi:hypothetical protein
MPAVPEMMTRLFTRSGWRTETASASLAPREYPTRWISEGRQGRDSRPLCVPELRSEMMAATASARASMVTPACWLPAHSVARWLRASSDLLPLRRSARGLPFAYGVTIYPALTLLPKSYGDASGGTLSDAACLTKTV